MQIDGDLAAAIGIVSSIVSSSIGYGVMKEKLRRTEKDIDAIRSDNKDYVTHNHFDAVLGPLRRTLELVQKDVKEILRAVSTKNQEED